MNKKIIVTMDSFQNCRMVQGKRRCPITLFLLNFVINAEKIEDIAENLTKPILNSFVFIITVECRWRIRTAAKVTLDYVVSITSELSKRLVKRPKLSVSLDNKSLELNTIKNNPKLSSYCSTNSVSKPHIKLNYNSCAKLFSIWIMKSSIGFSVLTAQGIAINNGTSVSICSVDLDTNDIIEPDAPNDIGSIEPSGFGTSGRIEPGFGTNGSIEPDIFLDTNGSIIAIFEVNNDKGAFPTGALPAGEFPAGAFPAGAYPAGAFPTGAYPTEAFPTGAAGNIKTCKKFLDTQYLYDETVSDALTGLIRTKVCRLIGQCLIAAIAKDSFVVQILCV